MRYILLAAALVCTAWSQETTQRMNRDSLMQSIRIVHQAPAAHRDQLEQVLLDGIRQRRLAFPIATDTEEDMHLAGASASLIFVAKQFQLTAAELLQASGASASSKIAKENLLDAVAGVRDQKTRLEREMLEQQLIESLQQRRLAFMLTLETEHKMDLRGASPRLIAAAKQFQMTAGDVLQTAEADLRVGRFQQAAEEAESAANLQPSLRAWQLLADAKARSGDTVASQQASLKALQAGGEIAIPVFFAPVGENFRTACDAVLVVGPQRVSLSPPSSIPPGCASRAGPYVKGAGIMEFGPNEFVGKERRAFHIVVQQSQGPVVNLCLAPARGGNEWALQVLAVAQKP